MSSPLWLVTLLIIPGLFGLALLMNWLEVYSTYWQVADEVASAWLSTESIDELELAVSRSAERVIAGRL
jgi:hypothetical protein